MKYPTSKKLLASADGLFAIRIEVAASFEVPGQWWGGDCIVHDAEKGFIRLHSVSPDSRPEMTWFPSFAAAQTAILSAGQVLRRLNPLANVETAPDGRNGVVLEFPIQYAATPDQESVTMRGKTYPSVADALAERASWPDSERWKNRVAMIDRDAEYNENAMR